MGAKFNKFLRYSFVGIIILCILVFSFLMIFMSRNTEKSIREVNNIYMSEMSIQLQQKFQSILDLRLEQVDAIIKGTPPNTVTYGEEMFNELRTSVEFIGFSYLGLYSEDGELESIYGEDISNNNNDIKILWNNDGNIIEQAFDKNKNKILLVGKAANYPMNNGKNSIALIAGISMEYLNESLYLYLEGAMVYSHIINTNGEFIIRNAGEYKGSYFERIRTVIDEEYRDEYASGLREAMDKGEKYSTFVLSDGEGRYIYCSPIKKNPDWYFITVMPNGKLNQSITKLDTIRTIIMIVSSIIILLPVSIIFYMYYKFSKYQMAELNKANQEAVNANLAKSEFLSSMSHDIRTPMNAIIGMTEIALKNLHNPLRIEDCLKKLKLSSKHLLGLINDVLDMSKIESGKMVLNINQMSLREIMDDILNIIKPQIKARHQYFDIFIKNILSEEVYCDSVRLNQILLNLLSNAVKFTPESGRINVHLYQEESQLGDEYVKVHFIVEDNGIGMSDEFQKKIFDTFEREDTEQVQKTVGTGLGMAITKCIVDLMEGTIDLKSKKGEGSKFHITLNLKKATIEESKMKLPAWNILVVDDNEELCYSAVANLKELGVNASWTLDGKEAIKMIEERHNNNEDYHFVLIDWKMPNMDGLETIRQIQNRIGKKIPIFLISAYDWGDIEEKIYDSDIEGFISKPLFKSTLFSRLIQYVSGESDDLEPQIEEDEDFSGKRMLLAEDIDINWEIANEILGATGLEIERAINGLDCVKQFEASEIGYYDIIFMDIRMPVMNGYDATKTIRLLERKDKDLPIIAMTADAFSDDAQHCLESGMDAHLTKPIDIKECIRMLKKYLD